MVYTGYYGGLSAVGGNMIKVQVSNSAPISVDTRFEKAIPDWAFIVKRILINDKGSEVIHSLYFLVYVPLFIPFQTACVNLYQNIAECF